MTTRRNTSDQSVAGRVAIVTGGSSGIGQATAIALARRGACVAVVGRDPGRLALAGTMLRRASTGVLDESSSYMTITGDVRDPADMERMAADVRQRFGRIDILVAAAGVGGSAGRTTGLPRAVIQTSVEEWDEVVDINLKGVLIAVRAVLPDMIEQRAGDIVIVSSSRGATRGRPYASAYCASKRALAGFTTLAAEQLSEHGIRMQALLPDMVDTPMIERAKHLAPRGAMSPDEVGRIIVGMIEWPDDSMLVDPLVAPFSTEEAVA